MHENVVPLLMGRVAHLSDPGLRGECVRRSIDLALAPTHCRVDSDCTAGHTRVWRSQREEDIRECPCRRFGLPEVLVWRVLRLAGTLRNADGELVGIADTVSEYAAVQGSLGSESLCTGSGNHDEQLTPELVCLATRGSGFASRVHGGSSRSSTSWAAAS